ncbi:MAG: helicase C-terminal domain-containing protein [Candidatus Aegiribacteria sp.]
MITGYDHHRKTLTIGIGDLINLGGLPDTLVPSRSALTVHQRQRAHSAYQRKLRAEGWETEVSVSSEHEVRGIVFLIRGRVDLLRRNEGELELLEVKTVDSGPDLMDPVEGRPSHSLQLCFYAGALSEQYEIPLERVRGALVYLPLGDGEHRPFRRDIDLADPGLDLLWRNLLEDTADMLLREDERKRLQESSLEGFEFPYDTRRPGQDMMMSEVESCVEKSGYLLMQAPTGTGKTAAVLTGAIRGALPERLTVFFLTAKNTHKLIVAETLKLIMEKGVPLRCIFIAARASVCHRGGDRCLPHDCPYAPDFGGRVRRSGVMEELLEEGIIEPDRLKRTAEKAGVCAFELGLCLSTGCDIVVCDYNYAFDPHVFLKRFFLERSTSSRCCLLIDEAANLPARVRDYYSPEVRRSWVEELLAHPEATGAWRKLLFPWVRCFEEWSSLLENSGEDELELPPETALPVGLDGWMEQIGMLKEPPEAMSEMVRAAVDISRVDPRDPRYHLLVRRNGEERVLQWFCTDPSDFLGGQLESCHSRVAFSATLSPFRHFAYLLGFPREETVCRDVPYPFPRKNLGVWICPDIDTRYRSRAECSGLLAERIIDIHSSCPGTWIVFFPSYSYMRMIAGILGGTGVPLLVQRPDMDRAERLDFLSRIEGEDNIVMTVSGGIFAEGVDIRSGSLRGAVVVGPSLPGMDLRQKLLAASYERREMNGFLHTWVIPGMVRVVQAAGRLIRNGRQRRALVLMGRRFTRQPYFDLLPGHWFTGGSIRFLTGSGAEIGKFLENKEGGA